MSVEGDIRIHGGVVECGGVTLGSMVRVGECGGVTLGSMVGWLSVEG